MSKTEKTGSLEVFFPHVVSQLLLHRRIENVFSFTRISLDGIEEMKYLRLIAGIVCERPEKAELEQMSRSAHKMCLLHTGEAADAILFSTPGEEYTWSNVELEGQDTEHMEVRSITMTPVLTEEEKGAALECMEIMLRAGNIKDSVNGVLAKIGGFYRADRVYVLALTEKCRVINMLYEWVREGKCSIQQAISGKQTDRFPVIARYAKNPSPMFLSMKEKKKESDGYLTDSTAPWRYAILSLESTEETERLLCIENPDRQLEGTALADYLIPFLMEEKARFRVQKKPVSSIDRLYSLPNQQSFLNAVYSLDSDTNSSLGVMAVDIPDFAGMKEQQGYEAGSRFLVRISDALLDVFGPSRLFHTKEAEFVVLCEDTTYEFFMNQCARARQRIGRRYEKKFRVGCTWSGGVFTASNLVQKACAIMRCSGAEYSGAAAGKETAGALLRENRMQNNEVQTIFLQPKVDMRTGELMGAEALFRILDEEGKLLPHLRVIEEMEKKGTIQKLDYFVLEEVFRTIGDWKRKGYPEIPVSSNFSRYTLLNPSSLASVLAISSRYPEVPLNQVEIEITETAGDFENNTFAELLERFGEYGVQFSLDDFGSSYSNMSMLANLHFHSIKLDRSMVRYITENRASGILVRDIAGLCRKCGMLCVAEGVETAGQAEALLQRGCRYAQGYYFGRPMPVQEFERKYFAAGRENGNGS